MNRYRISRRFIVVLAGLYLAIAGMAAAQPEHPFGDTIVVSFVIDGPGEQNELIASTFIDEITALTRDEFAIVFPEEHRYLGDWTVGSIEQAIGAAFESPEVDVVVALGGIASYLLATRQEHPRVSIAPFAIDIEWQQLPFEGPGSGEENLNYLISLPDASRGVRKFHEITPFEHLVLVNYRPYHEAFPLNTQLLQLGQAMGFEMTLVQADSSAADVLTRLPENADAVYVLPLLFAWSESEVRALAEGFKERGLPSFSYIGRDEVELGFLAGLGRKVSFTRLARRVALNFQRVLLGDRPQDLPVDFSQREQLTINMATARAIGIFPDWAIMTEAELINERRSETGRMVTLRSAVTEALEANLSYRANRFEVAAGAETVGQARANLLPQMDASLQGVVIDKERAENQFSTQAERTLTGSLRLSQVLYSDEAWAGYTIEQRLQARRELARETLRLDIILEAASAYLNVLRALTLENIQKNNLQLTRSNLELARTRRAIGQSGPGEVYRWESQIATNRKDVVDATAQRNVAEIQLNRVMNKPAEEPFSAEPTDVFDPQLLVNDPRMQPYIDNKWAFRLLRDFLVEEALAESPELQQYDELIAAQRRRQSAARRSFFIPTLAAQGRLDYKLAEGGVGSSSDEISFELPGAGALSFEEPEDLQWNVGVSLTLPLYEGGRRFAEVGEASATLRQLELERAQVAEQVEQRTRSALHLFGADYAAIGFSEAAADAARANLELVTDAYSRGTVSIIELLDAQNAALVADLVAANARFDYLLSYMDVQRAVADFDLFTTAEERAAFFDRLDAFFDAAEEEAGQ